MVKSQPIVFELNGYNYAVDMIKVTNIDGTVRTRATPVKVFALYMSRWVQFTIDEQGWRWQELRVMEDVYGTRRGWSH